LRSALDSFSSLRPNLLPFHGFVEGRLQLLEVGGRLRRLSPEALGPHLRGAGARRGHEGIIPAMDGCAGPEPGAAPALHNA
jgi:hypothetical protein